MFHFVNIIFFFVKFGEKSKADEDKEKIKQIATEKEEKSDLDLIMGFGNVCSGY